jgi:endogenous inhibitor of DNA gyrase (YacG/DUF329 family)
MTATPPASTPKRSAACPICRRPVEARFRPFCSARCADVDLGRWFNESYRVPSVESDEEIDEQVDGREDLPG